MMKKIIKDTFKALMVRIWRVEGSVFFKEIQDNLWLFEFSEEADKQKVLEGQPRSYDRTILVINEFDPQTPRSQMCFRHTPNMDPNL